MRRSGVRLFSPAPASVSGWRFVSADPFVGAGLRRIRRRRCRPRKGKRLAARLARAKASRWLHGGYTPSLNESQLRDLACHHRPLRPLKWRHLRLSESTSASTPEAQRHHRREASTWTSQCRQPVATVARRTLSARHRSDRGDRDADRSRSPNQQGSSDSRAAAACRGARRTSRSKWTYSRSNVSPAAERPA
jgi:hypothetical protein